MITPAVSIGGPINSSICRNDIARRRARTASAIPAPRKSAMFLFPKKATQRCNAAKFSAPPSAATAPGKLPLMTTKVDARLIRAIGRMTGRIDQKNDGNSDSGFLEIPSRSVSAAPRVSRNGMSTRALIHFAA